MKSKNRLSSLSKIFGFSQNFQNWTCTIINQKTHYLKMSLMQKITLNAVAFCILIFRFVIFFFVFFSFFLFLWKTFLRNTLYVVVITYQSLSLWRLLKAEGPFVCGVFSHCSKILYGSLQFKDGKFFDVSDARAVIAISMLITHFLRNIIDWTLSGSVRAGNCRYFSQLSQFCHVTNWHCHAACDYLKPPTDGWISSRRNFLIHASGKFWC